MNTLIDHQKLNFSMKAREGENKDTWFRCNRYYNLKGRWFFSTREGVDFGPYQDQKEADQELKDFIAKSDSPKKNEPDA